MNIIDVLNWRYSTKEFDKEKKISDEDFQKVKDILRMSPSSTNIQPWHFLIANTENGKQRIAKGTEGFCEFNKAKVLDASHVVVFCAKVDTDERYMKKKKKKEDTDGRYPNEEIQQMMHGARSTFANIHKYDMKDFQHWVEKQLYLNMGNFLLGVAALDIDALPMEGLDFKTIDEEFQLREKGLTSVAVVSIGYRTESDFNTPNKTPKSRLAEEEVITVVS